VPTSITIFSGNVQVRRPLPRLLALVLAAALLAVWPSLAEAQTTFTVNNTGDAADTNLTDTVCDTSGKSGNQCTLRAAIQQANATANVGGPDEIRFNIPGDKTKVKTINVGSTTLGALPPITEAVTMNGYTQRGAKENTRAAGNDAVLKVQLNGTSAGSEPW
jgi:CSLREA domain-containing protein